MPKKRIRIHKKGRRAVAFFALWVSLVFLAFLVWGVLFYREPEGVKSTTRILRALTTSRIVGDLWGLDLYFEKRNKELSSRDSPELKEIMLGLFAEKILRFSSWERTTDDLTYAFYLLRKARLDSMPESAVLFVRARERLFFLFWRQVVVSAELSSQWKALRSRENKISPDEAEKIYKEMLPLEPSAVFKAQLLGRIAAFEEQGDKEKPIKEIKQLESYKQQGLLTLSLSLLVDELKKQPNSLSRTYQHPKEDWEERRQNALLDEYAQALDSLSGYNPEQFVERAKNMAKVYEKREIAPMLLYLAWSVLQHDARDPESAAKVLSELKEKYPASAWSYPERAERTKKQVRETLFKKLNLRKITEAFNGLSLLFNRCAEEVILKARAISDGLEQGHRYEKVFDEETVKRCFEKAIPGPLKHFLSGMHVSLREDGVNVYTGFKWGPLELSVSAHGQVVSQSRENNRTFCLKLKEIRIQNMLVPSSLLRQAERDFNVRIQKAGLPLTVLEIKYWQGGAKIVLEKKEELLLEEPKEI